MGWGIKSFSFDYLLYHARFPENRTVAASRSALEVKGLMKTYRGSNRLPPKEALKGIDLAIPRGGAFRPFGAQRRGQIDVDQHSGGIGYQVRRRGARMGVRRSKSRRGRRAAPSALCRRSLIWTLFHAARASGQQAGHGVPKRERITDQLLETVDLTAIRCACPNAFGRHAAALDGGKGDGA